MMSDIINNLAKMEISEDVLSRIDMQGLANEFKINFGKLDEFQRIKEKYENRSFWEKVADSLTFDNTMEKAEQNALVAQGDFLKITGRLMVLNIAMSKRLEEQQCNILKHQEILELNSKNITTQTTNIQKQQNVLEEQHHELSNLLRNYMELKGLTRDGAQKLIQIAQDVCSVKENIEKKFNLFEKDIDDKIQDVYELGEKNKLMYEEKIDLLSKKNNETEKEIKDFMCKFSKETQQLFDDSKKTVDNLAANLEEKSDSLKKYVSEKIITINKYQDSEFKLVRDELENSKLNTEKEISNLQGEVCERNRMIETFSQNLATMEVINKETKERIERIFQYTKITLGILSICIIGIIISIIN